MSPSAVVQRALDRCKALIEHNHRKMDGGLPREEYLMTVGSQKAIRDIMASITEDIQDWEDDED